jgi:nitroreductase
MLIDLLNCRRSVLSFSLKKVEPEKLDKIFKAASLAPSSMNIQPWRYIYAQKDEPTYNSIFNTLADGNKRWAKDAEVLILCLALKVNLQNIIQQENRHAWHDAGMANIQLMLQATELGLATHPMGGFNVEKIREAITVPIEFDPIVIIALGYPGDEGDLPADLMERQRKSRLRKNIDEIVFREGNSLKI